MITYGMLKTVVKDLTVAILLLNLYSSSFTLEAQDIFDSLTVFSSSPVGADVPEVPLAFA